jgi:hypothetical protein
MAHKTKKIMKYVVSVPFVDDMGSITSFTAASSQMETARENALDHINRMREHDNLQPLKRLPNGTTLLPC